MVDDIYVKALAKNSQVNTIDINNITNNGQIKGFIILTQAEYTALNPKDPEIVYLIRG
jgi:hypothetical protein